MSQFTGYDVVNRLAISPSLLHLWEQTLGMHSRRASWRKRRYDDGTLEILEAVKRLRAGGQDFAAIARELAPRIREMAGSEQNGNTRSSIQETTMRQNERTLTIEGRSTRTVGEAGGDNGGPVRRHPEPLRTVPVELMEHLNEVQDQHTKAVYLIGQLEERLKTKDQRIAELQAELATPEKQFQEMLLLQELKDAQKYIGMLEAELAQRKARPGFELFSRWLGRWSKKPEPQPA